MLSVGILVFDDVEILDFSGPYEVFSTAARLFKSQPQFRCYLIAPDMRPIRARGGMKVLPDCVLLPSSDIDVLIVPGGDVSGVLGNKAVIDWIRMQAAGARITASVCTGTFLLAEAGLLNGLDATTHWVDCDKAVSSGGISNGIDMSLHLVERLAGRQLAEATARQIEYRWNREVAHDFSRSTDSRVLPAAQRHAGVGLERAGRSLALCKPA